MEYYIIKEGTASKKIPKAKFALGISEKLMMKILTIVDKQKLQQAPSYSFTKEINDEP
jgi:hypothetical protein